MRDNGIAHVNPALAEIKREIDWLAGKGFEIFVRGNADDAEVGFECDLSKARRGSYANARAKALEKAFEDDPTIRAAVATAVRPKPAAPSKDYKTTKREACRKLVEEALGGVSDADPIPF